MIETQALDRAAFACVERLAVGEHDRVLVVSNPPQRCIADALLKEAQTRAASVRHVEYPTLSRHGEEPPRDVAQLLPESTVAFAPTVFSISHTRARLEATARGVRIAGMSSLDDAAFASAVAIDYARLEHSTRSVASALTRADICHITSAAGTDLVLCLRGRAAVEDNGDLRRRGAFGNLPAGEAYVAPLENYGEGSVVVDGSVAGYGLVRQPLGIAVRNGRVVSATGQAADWFLATLDAGNGQGGRVIAELGIGVNPGARVSGITILDEKALGTAHIAFGTNVSFGGVNSASVHIDCVLLAPTLDVDGQALIREGASCW